MSGLSTSSIRQIVSCGYEEYISDILKQSLKFCMKGEGAMLFWRYEECYYHDHKGDDMYLLYEWCPKTKR
jgi:hypothetical protein